LARCRTPPGKPRTGVRPSSGSIVRGTGSATGTGKSAVEPESAPTTGGGGIDCVSGIHIPGVSGGEDGTWIAGHVGRNGGGGVPTRAREYPDTVETGHGDFAIATGAALPDQYACWTTREMACSSESESPTDERRLSQSSSERPAGAWPLGPRVSWAANRRTESICLIRWTMLSDRPELGTSDGPSGRS
jgi:hypothetical protein